jgi:signal transduction histidine kinase
VDDGDQISLRFFYCLAVMIAVTARGWKFGILTAVFSVILMTAGDLSGYDKSSRAFLLTWNALISFSTYLLIVWLLNSLFTLQREIEERVRAGTRALILEAARREQLEQEIMNLSEKERFSIGHDLHDGLCQHLMGTAYASRMLADELASRPDALAERAMRIVTLIDDAVGQTRRLAKGLSLTSLERDGLIVALEELATSSSEQFQLQCTFACHGEPRLSEPAAASNLFRIAQEAVRNAARHGKPGRIAITLAAEPSLLTLSVADNGVGMKDEGRPSNGMGLGIMSYRAGIIGATFALETAPEKGTCITCRLPLECPAR